MSKSNGTKPTPKAAEANGYKAHVEGSRKGKVHELFDKQGDQAAWVLGQKLGLKQGTLRSWFGQWRREAEAANSKAKGKGEKSKTARAEAVNELDGIPATT
jgi:hypothetical protein